MATSFSFLASVAEKDLPRTDSVLVQAHRLVALLEQELSEFLPPSPVYRLARSQVGEKISASESLLNLLDRSLILGEKTGWAFDVTAKSGDQGNNLLDRFSWDRSEKTVWRNFSDSRLGFGAIGKGYALDQVRGLLERDGIENFVLNAGGSSIVLSGYAAPGLPWSWAWCWRRDADENLLGVEFIHQSGSVQALGISGAMEQAKHLLDPLTKMPVDGPQSALVAQSSAADADALSTALYVLGWDEGIKRIPDSINQAAIGIIDKKEIPLWNGVFNQLWGAPAQVALMSLALFFTPIFAFSQEDGAIDLSSLGFSTFTPYITERNNWWILLPLAVLAMVVLHLPFSWNRKRPRKG
jgi:thiamine biosynthesis lipoprotein